MRPQLQSAGIFVILWLSASSALAWNPMIRKNPNVEKGNQSLQQKNYDAARSDYKSAAEKHPNEPRLMLNQGLADLGAQQSEEAKKDFLQAATRSTDPEIKSKAYYNLGTALLNESLNAATEQKKNTLEQSVDALKKSLRAKHSNADAAWNLALAKQELQKTEEQQKQQQQNQQQNQNQDKKDQKDNQPQPQQNDSKPKSDDSKSQSDKTPAPQNDQQNQQPKAGDQGQNQQTNDSNPPPQGQKQSEAARTQEQQKALLDALERQEKSLPAQLMQRRSTQRQKPEKDW